MRQIVFLTLAVCLLSVLAFPQTADEMAKARSAEQLAGKAYEAKSYGEFLTQMQLANTARPNHPRLTYNLASAYAVNGQTDAALDMLERLAKMGLYFPAEKDDDFKAMLSSERFKSIQAKLLPSPTKLCLSRASHTTKERRPFISPAFISERS